MALLCGDTHITKDNLKESALLFDLIDKTIKKYKENNLIFLGDIYDTKAIIRSEAQNFFLEQLQKLVWKYDDLSIYILVGNHDFENLDCLAHALNPAKLIKNVNVVDRPKRFDALSAGMIPYVHHKDDFIEQVKSITSAAGVKYIYCHQGIEGFYYDNGVVDKHGVNLEDLPKKLKFIVGHYHKYQEKYNVIYLGSPMSHSFREYNYENYLAIQRDDSFELINTNDYLPKHYRVKYFELSGDFDFGIEKIKSKDLVEVVIHCSQSTQKTFTKDFIASKLPVQPSVLRINYHLIDDTNQVRIEEKTPLEEMVKKYLQSKKNEGIYNKAMEYLSNANL